MNPVVGITFRKATSDDVPSLVRLRINQLKDEGYSQSSDIRSELTQYFTGALKDNSFVGWVGEQEGDIIATAGMCFYRLPPSFSNATGDVAYLTNIFTSKQYRGQGIASFLVSTLVEEAKSLGYRSLKLHASDLGKAIYQRAGFVDSEGYMALKI